MVLITADLALLESCALVGAGLVLYWNGSRVLYRTALVMLWHGATFQAYVMTMLVYHAVGSLFHLSRTRWRAFGTREAIMAVLTHMWPTSLGVTLLVLYAGSVLDSWSMCVVSHAALATWLAALRLWLRSSRSNNTNSSAWERLQLVLCYAAAVCTLALKWSYLATLDVTADVTVPRELTHTNVNVWYLAVVSTLGLLWEALLGTVTAVLRLVLRGPWRLPFQTHFTRLTLGRSAVIDPHSDEFALVCGRAHAALVLVSAWLYCPPHVPAVFQLIFLARLYVAHRASKRLKDYQSVLDAFPIVGPEPTVPQDSNNSEDVCAICQEPLFPSSGTQHAAGPVRQLPCGHRLHGSCLRPWVVQHPVCPLCRHPTATRARAGNGAFQGVTFLRVYTAVAENEGRRDTRRPRRPRRPSVPPAPPHDATPVPSPVPPEAATITAVVPPPPVPASGVRVNAFGGGSVQPLVPRLGVRPSRTAVAPHPVPPPAPSPARASPAPAQAPSTSTSTSASSASSWPPEARSEMDRVEAALQRVRGKRQRVLASLAQDAAPTQASSDDRDRLFADDPELMGGHAATRFRRRE